MENNNKKHSVRTGIALLALVSTLAGCAGYGPSWSTAGTSSAQSSTAGTCKPTSQAEIANLFEDWNRALQTGDPHKVAMRYAEKSILLPTVSNKPRLTMAEKEDYFHHFLENAPSGKIDQRVIDIDCNTASDAGLYTFTFGKTGAVVKARYSYTYRWDGKSWLITSHHSSAMPEKI